MLVHNITKLVPSSEGARSVRIAGREIRPGKAADIPVEELGTKIHALHGKLIWIGPLPKNLREAAAPVRMEAPPMDEAAALAYLETKTEEELLWLAGQMIPPMQFNPKIAHAVTAARVVRGLFFGNRVLDPASFFWLGWWRKEGDQYIEVDSE